MSESFIQLTTDGTNKKRGIALSQPLIVFGLLQRLGFSTGGAIRLFFFGIMNRTDEGNFPHRVVPKLRRTDPIGVEARPWWAKLTRVQFARGSLSTGAFLSMLDKRCYYMHVNILTL
ncbi:hypothetical protein COS16_03395 [Candidatus Desantisbacteria bacterium CG02_land_8_20_14_3_00_49_13]|nr:MAG: hypothetical protein COS16_03395 [Candidatus Desantisbacteria bacterium CG02_land_8_20_14_3_00_49_13]